uniref:Uncharacterized protein n=1 Tax=Anguilla anguilla TaxID=7936 RepID=A0A0E9UC23_ANGAN
MNHGSYCMAWGCYGVCVFGGVEVEVDGVYFVCAQRVVHQSKQ